MGTRSGVSDIFYGESFPARILGLSLSRHFAPKLQKLLSSEYPDSELSNFSILFFKTRHLKIIGISKEKKNSFIASEKFIFQKYVKKRHN